MSENSFDVIQIYLEELEKSVSASDKERFNFLQMKSEELIAYARYTNHDTVAFAEYIADVGKGLIPVPEIIVHSYPNYPKFSTYKDGSFESGDYEVYQLWVMKQLDVDVMSKPKKIKASRLLITVSSGIVAVTVAGLTLFSLTNLLIINPVKSFSSWWSDEQQIDSPWEVGKANSYDYSRENILRILEQRKIDNCNQLEKVEDREKCFYNLDN